MQAASNHRLDQWEDNVLPIDRVVLRTMKPVIRVIPSSIHFLLQLVTVEVEGILPHEKLVHDDPK